MRIGYPCINLTLDCKGDRTYRLKSYSEERLIATIDNNLDCLLKMLRFNAEHNILFFRITSDLVPFASHPICRFDWQSHFNSKFKHIGNFIHKYGIRISMHPDQFTLINSVDERIFEQSLKELAYHAQVLDSLGLDSSAKIQIHVGGVYADKENSKARFIKRHKKLPETIRKRLVIENDDRRFTLNDCLSISGEIGIPVLFDVFHHEVNSSGETVKQALQMVRQTWLVRDGVPMVDFSAQERGDIKGKHVESIDLKKFREFLEITKPYDFDIMLEIKDKENSALKAVRLTKADSRFLMLRHTE